MGLGRGRGGCSCATARQQAGRGVWLPVRLEALGAGGMPGAAPAPIVQGALRGAAARATSLRRKQRQGKGRPTSAGRRGFGGPCNEGGEADRASASRKGGPTHSHPT
ncbi:hypothetical protein NDU88_002161 [Pleurodeles waltl]|uniref:Uncharacterized protein n=1 Tax=Pleurodeles waltl TaxID=8319 RepID=A0AAV7RD73_PLEWA|nr:hypothetical protein NDU88_002161 [Pleurodeles waltl]